MAIKCPDSVCPDAIVSENLVLLFLDRFKERQLSLRMRFCWDYHLFTYLFRQRQDGKWKMGKSYLSAPSYFLFCSSAKVDVIKLNGIEWERGKGWWIVYFYVVGWVGGKGKRGKRGKGRVRTRSKSKCSPLACSSFIHGPRMIKNNVKFRELHNEEQFIVYVPFIIHVTWVLPSSPFLAIHKIKWRRLGMAFPTTKRPPFHILRVERFENPQFVSYIVTTSINYNKF